MRFVRYVWAFPVTFLGLMLVALTVFSGGRAQLRNGVVEAWGGAIFGLLKGGRIRRGGAAMALGHVILARDADCLALSRNHELQHVRQFEQWGPLMLPAYWLVAFWLWIRRYDPYLDHPFEPPPG